MRLLVYLHRGPQGRVFTLRLSHIFATMYSLRTVTEVNKLLQITASLVGVEACTLSQIQLLLAHILNWHALLLRAGTFAAILVKLTTIRHLRGCCSEGLGALHLHSGAWGV